MANRMLQVCLKILRWGDYSGLLDEPSVITRVFIRGMQLSEKEKKQREDKRRRERRCYTAGLDDGGRGHETRNRAGFQKLL